MPYRAISTATAFILISAFISTSPPLQGFDESRPSWVWLLARAHLDRSRIILRPGTRKKEAEQRNFLGLPAAPLDEPLVTDRPDATESPETVPYGRIQLEMGYTFTRDRGEHEQGLPEFLARIGLMKNLELRLGWDGLVWTDGDYQGGSDMTVGAKYKILENEGWIPDFAVIGTLSLPTGSDETSSGDVDPELVLCWSYGLSERFTLSGNVLFGVPSDPDEGGRFFQSGSSISLGISVTEKIGSYVEYFGRYPAAKGTGAEHSANGGFTYLINKNLQVDVRVGFGLNRRAPDFFTGGGLAVRF